MIFKPFASFVLDPTQVYKKSLGSSCNKDTVLLGLYAEDNVNVETRSKVTKPVEILSSLLTSDLLSITCPECIILVRVEFYTSLDPIGSLV